MKALDGQRKPAMRLERTRMPNVIRPLLLGKQTFSKGQFTYFMNYEIKIWVPIVAWHIQTADSEILVDTGITGQDLKRYLFGNLYEDNQSMEEALAGIGSSPDRIRIIIQTHLHYDHCGNNKLFPGAKVFIQARELAFAKYPHPVFKGSYNPSFFEGSDFEIVEGEKEIVPGVSVVPVPGHTPGTQAVLVDLKGKKAALTGFCCILDNFEPPEKIRKHWPVIPIGVSANSLEAYDSMLKLKDMAELIIPMHSMEYAEMKLIE